MTATFSNTLKRFMAKIKILSYARCYLLEMIGINNPAFTMYGFPLSVGGIHHLSSRVTSSFDIYHSESLGARVTPSFFQIYHSKCFAERIVSDFFVI